MEVHVSVRNNGLLARLKAPALAALGELDPVTLGLRDQLDARIDKHVYFPTSGVASVIADFSGLPTAELGIIGREGMIGLGVLYGDVENPYQTVVQVEGTALRVDA